MPCSDRDRETWRRAEQTAHSTMCPPRSGYGAFFAGMAAVLASALVLYLGFRYPYSYAVPQSVVTVAAPSAPLPAITPTPPPPPRGPDPVVYPPPIVVHVTDDRPREVVRVVRVRAPERKHRATRVYSMRCRDYARCIQINRR